MKKELFSYVIGHEYPSYSDKWSLTKLFIDLCQFLKTDGYCISERHKKKSDNSNKNQDSFITETNNLKIILIKNIRAVK